jgi:murein DD-endopeptidase MepM/ murein hydrolase activator NlpD
MTQRVRAFAYPRYFLFQRNSQRLAIFSIIFLAAVVVFISSSDYIADRFPGTLWNMTGNYGMADQDGAVGTVLVKRGDTLSSILRDQGLTNTEIQAVIKASSKEKAISKLAIGQELKFYYDIQLVEQEETDIVEERQVLNRMSFKIDNIKSVELVKTGDEFVVHHINAPLKKLISKYDATVNSSLIAALQEAGMSTSSIIKLVNAYSHQVDFQRQIHQGDTISVVTEKFVTEENEFSHHGKILYASLKASGVDYNIYLYSPTGKEADIQFFSEEGQSIKSSLLKTPVDVVRVSSHYGYRKKHPILGYGRMHKGVDFSASNGTPIYAAGDGVVKFAGWKNGYGKFVIVKHGNGLSTAYGHASKFAAGLKEGAKVKQGDVIAYVGSTGHATGPHLHYEIRVNDKQVNPLEFKSTPSIKLAGAKLSKFNSFKQQMHGLGKKLNSKELSASDVSGIKLF